MSSRVKEVSSGKERSTSSFREYVEALAMAIVLALFIRTFVVQAFKIPSGSMLPTLQIGDHLLVNKFIYGIRIPLVGKRILEFRAPKRNDVIVFIYPEDPTKDFIKRVEGAPGDTIEIRNKLLYVNGRRVPDEHGFHGHGGSRSPRDNFGPFTVPEGQVFVMGDNRDHSYDSRFWGTVPMENILGKAFVLYWSWDAQRFRPRWNRIGRLIP